MKPGLFRALLIVLILAGLHGGLLWGAPTKPKEKTTAKQVPAKPEARKSQDLQYYLSRDKTYSLYIPRGWTVTSDDNKNGKLITASAPCGLPCIVFYSCTITAEFDAVAFSKAILSTSTKYFSDIKITEAFATKDRKRVTLEFQYTYGSKELDKCRYYVTTEGTSALVMECSATAAEFKKQKPLLISMLSKIKLMSPPQAAAAPAKPDIRNNPDAPFLYEMVPYTSQDGSCRISIPNGWKVTAGKGAMLVTSPDGGSGFAFSTTNFIGQGNVPYLDSGSLPGLHYSYRGPAESMSLVLGLFGSSNIRYSRYSNNAQAATVSALLRREAESEYAVMTYTSKKGVNTEGFFDITTMKPLASGQWGVMYEGIWAPRSQYNRYLLTLVDMWESFSINEEWAAEYVRQGVENLKRLAADTIAKSRRYAEEIRQANTAAFQERMRSGDYIDYKRSSMIRGQQDWVSGIEGGSVYTSDSDGLNRDGRRIIEGQGANYHNFDGEKHGLIPLDVNREFFDARMGR
ncbi:MAG: hypothetical protein RDV48_15120 [Candidatus Eremiobacteraeota bacterium]|nr:hypothetical protein [Candidatus Eremiobacteraeota bacterium]